MKIEKSRRQSGDSNRRKSGKNQGAPMRKRKPTNDENSSSVWTFKGSDNKNESQDRRRTNSSDRDRRPQSRENERGDNRERRSTPERRSYSSREESPRRVIKKEQSNDNNYGDRPKVNRYRNDDSSDNRRSSSTRPIIKRDSRDSNENPRERRLPLSRTNEGRSDEREERRPRPDRGGDIRQRSERRLNDKNERYNERERPPRRVVSRAKRSTAAPKDDLRLNKFIANSGICSRREADEYIEAGVVTVNGVVVNTLGARVKPTDEIRFNDQRLQGEKKVYILLNKPKGYVTTVEDPHADATVMDLIKGGCKERVYPVGRLDKNTTGVLLFTNDGELTKNLTHPTSEKMKIYHVYLDKNFTKNDMQRLVDGFALEDGFTQADAAEYVEDKKDEIGIEIHSGRNRIVRRMFEHLGYKVIKLDRVYFAGLTKKGLRRGAWRVLTPKEVAILKMGQFE